MSQPYTSEEIDQIEEEFKNLNLENDDVEMIENLTYVAIIESENDLDINPENIEIVKKPTSIKFVENE